MQHMKTQSQIKETRKEKGGRDEKMELITHDRNGK